MATIVSIIEVDLGEDVQTIINDEVTSLNAKNLQQLDSLRVVAELQGRMAEQIQQKKDNETKIKEKLTEIEALLVSSGANGIKSEDLIITMQPLMTTLSGFSNRMKSHLKANGNKYMLQKDKNHYKLVAYNLSENDPLDEI